MTGLGIRDSSAIPNLNLESRILESRVPNPGSERREMAKRLTQMVSCAG
jgi:hypothetical protein